MNDDDLPPLREVLERLILEHDAGGITLSAMHEARAALAQALDPQPAQQSVDDSLRQDAERYRWLRRGNSWPAGFADCYAPEPLRGADIDAAIDAAIAQEKSK